MSKYTKQKKQKHKTIVSVLSSFPILGIPAPATINAETFRHSSSNAVVKEKHRFIDEVLEQLLHKLPSEVQEKVKSLIRYNSLDKSVNSLRGYLNQKYIDENLRKLCLLNDEDRYIEGIKTKIRSIAWFLNFMNNAKHTTMTSNQLKKYLLDKMEKDNKEFVDLKNAMTAVNTSISDKNGQTNDLLDRLDKLRKDANQTQGYPQNVAINTDLPSKLINLNIKTVTIQNEFENPINIDETTWSTLKQFLPLIGETIDPHAFENEKILQRTKIYKIWKDSGYEVLNVGVDENNKIISVSTSENSKDFTVPTETFWFKVHQDRLYFLYDYKERMTIPEDAVVNHYSLSSLTGKQISMTLDDMLQKIMKEPIALRKELLNVSFLNICDKDNNIQSKFDIKSMCCMPSAPNGTNLQSYLINNLSNQHPVCYVNNFVNCYRDGLNGSLIYIKSKKFKTLYVVDPNTFEIKKISLSEIADESQEKMGDKLINKLKDLFPRYDIRLNENTKPIMNLMNLGDMPVDSTDFIELNLSLLIYRLSTPFAFKGILQSKYYDSKKETLRIVDGNRRVDINLKDILLFEDDVKGLKMVKEIKERAKDTFPEICNSNQESR